MHHFLLCNVRIPRFITLYLLIPKIIYCYYIGNLSLFPPYSQITLGNFPSFIIFILLVFML